MLKKLWKPPSRKNLIPEIPKENICSQTIILWLTVILFHSNWDKKVTSNQQKLTCNE